MPQTRKENVVTVCDMDVHVCERSALTEKTQTISAPAPDNAHLRWEWQLRQIVNVCVTALWVWMCRVLGRSQSSPRRCALERRLGQCQTYGEWRPIGRQLDELDGFAGWRGKEGAELYNAVGAMQTIASLAEFRRQRDTRGMLQILTSRVQRSAFGVDNPLLYKYRTGTKDVVQTYTALVCYLLRGLTKVDETQVTLQERASTLTRMLESYGSSAIVLRGGALCGPLHMGVAKTLLDAGLLPRIVYGSGSGALVAALLCSCPSDARSLDLAKLRFTALEGIPVAATLTRRFQRFVTEGYLMNTDVLVRFARDNIGDLTFADAYRLSGRMLNVEYTTSYHDENSGRTVHCSTLLNYLTAPDVLVYTAAIASLGSTPFVFRRVPLLARDIDGKLIEYDPAVLVQRYQEKHDDSRRGPPRTALDGLREMFHVHYFVVSECSLTRVASAAFRRRVPYVASFLLFLVQEAFRLFCWVLSHTPLEPLVASLVACDEPIDLVQGGRAGMLIYPTTSLREWYQLWSSPSRETMRDWVERCKWRVWPRLEEIRQRRSIERNLNAVLRQLREQQKRRSSLPRSRPVATAAASPKGTTETAQGKELPSLPSEEHEGPLLESEQQMEHLMESIPRIEKLKHEKLQLEPQSAVVTCFCQ